jgi:hypothetical protein
LNDILLIGCVEFIIYAGFSILDYILL